MLLKGAKAPRWGLEKVVFKFPSKTELSQSGCAYLLKAVLALTGK